MDKNLSDAMDITTKNLGKLDVCKGPHNFVALGDDEFAKVTMYGVQRCD